MTPALLLPLLALACGDDKDSSDDTATPEGGPVQVDMLFVIDNSPSMYGEASALGLAFEAFLDALGDVGGLQLAITTTSADPNGEVDPGEVGTLTGAGVLSADTPADLAEAFREVLLCETTCWPGECQGEDSTGCIPYDDDYACGDDPGEVISWDYLACICGDGWEPPECGTGTEEGLEAALLTLCRADSSPPEACFTHDGSPLAEADSGSITGLLRSDASTEVVIVSDEGDSSRALAQGEDDPQLYLDMFAQLANAPTFIVIGPAYDAAEHSFPCNSGGATSWGTTRYQLAAERTGGFYRDIEDEASGECGPSDFGAHLVQMAEHIGG